MTNKTEAAHLIVEHTINVISKLGLDRQAAALLIIEQAAAVANEPKAKAPAAKKRKKAA